MTRGRWVHIVTITFPDGDSIEAWSTAGLAEKRAADINRRAKEEEDYGTYAIATKRPIHGGRDLAFMRQMGV